MTYVKTQLHIQNTRFKEDHPLQYLAISVQMYNKENLYSKTIYAWKHSFFFVSYSQCFRYQWISLEIWMTSEL